MSAIGSFMSSPSTRTVYKPGDRSPLGHSGALQEARQQAEHARGIAARRRRLPGAEADLALCHGEAGERVHQQQHVAVLVAEPLGDACGEECRPDPHQRRRVRSGDDDDRSAPALCAEDPLDELGDLPAPFADEGDDRYVGRGAPRDHRHERGLADTRAGEDAEALASPARNEPVEDPHAELELVRDETTTERVRRRTLDADLFEPDERRPVVDRAAEAVENTTKQLFSDADGKRTTGVLDKGPDAESGRVPIGKARHAVAAQSDDLGEDRLFALAKQQAAVADSERDSDDLDGHADHAHDAPVTVRAGRGHGAVPHGGQELGHDLPVASSRTLRTRARAVSIRGVDERGADLEDASAGTDRRVRDDGHRFAEL